MQEMWVRSLGGEDPLEEDMATHSSILAWRIPWTEEPGGLQPVGSQSQTRLSEHTQEEGGLPAPNPSSLLPAPDHQCPIKENQICQSLRDTRFMFYFHRETLK